MFRYYVSILRDGKQFYVTHSSIFNEYELQEGDWNGISDENPPHLWNTEQGPAESKPLKDLLEDGDKVFIIRVYTYMG